ncbi:MAG TPA: arsenite methyltransferase [Candidatus Nanoarchaeia archaeon]|nr:arsenite methyltransferase [Candidatus Nanoarchaeia archaeon]
MKDKKIKEAVKKRYSEFAKAGTSCCPTCGPDFSEQAKKIGYSKKELEQLPKEAVMGLGCGNPTALAELKEGETVLDLGAGAGIDVFLAAKKVGPKGYVIGVDMTEPMVEKANKIAQRDGYKNVEFRLGEVENLPVKDNSIDVIISNCVINLSPDKLRTYKEAHRVLKIGGRILISDLVTEGKLPDHIKRSFDTWVACIGGAMEREEYLGVIRKAGFHKIDIVNQHTYTEPGMNASLDGKITSIQVRAYK